VIIGRAPLGAVVIIICHNLHGMFRPSCNAREKVSGAET
jgi:hypothetical protein